ncbi:MAG TPA: hypothetical protein VNX70_11240 [Bryobacteraceae bacterium]|jgi:hypothetical protein|nr:hypothetical protein [Bryobacteraceae bacterium]
MNTAIIVSLLLCALPAGSMADKPKVTRTMIEAMEKSVDGKLQKLFSPDPVEVLGVQGGYINGYGAVFMSEINLAPAAGITPFHPTVSPDEIKRTHDRKVQRIAALRNSMRDMLVDSAASLDSVPADEQVALGVSLFYWTWENREGLPAQIVMHAPKKLLLQAKAGTADKGAIASDEF